MGQVFRTTHKKSPWEQDFQSFSFSFLGSGRDPTVSQVRSWGCSLPCGNLGLMNGEKMLEAPRLPWGEECRFLRHPQTGSCYVGMVGVRMDMDVPPDESQRVLGKGAHAGPLTKS